MLVRLCKRRGEFPTGSIVDLPADEAQALIGFGLAEPCADPDAEAPRKPVERATVRKGARTATLPSASLSVAENSLPGDSE